MSCQVFLSAKSTLAATQDMDKSTTVHVSLPALSHDAHPTTVYIVKTRDEHGEYVAKCALDDGEEAICTIGDYLS